MRWRAWAAALAIVIPTSTPSQAQSSASYAIPPLSDSVQASRYKDFKSPWREHLLKVREVQKFQNPLERCLAWPDLPGNQWPAGHASALCRHYHDDSVGVYRLDWLEKLLQQGDLTSINAALDAQLELHFRPEQQFHEAIHSLVDKIEADERSDTLTSRWLRAAPDDAYALLARATFYRKAAWEARGEKYASETAASQMSRMSELVERAVPLYRKAIAANPRLMPAYEGLLNVATGDSLDTVATEAVRGAKAVDPACVAVAKERMRALQPRWGGSYEAMDAYVEELRPLIATRPLLAQFLGSPAADAANMAGALETAEGDTLAVQMDKQAIAPGANLWDISEAASHVNILSRRNGVGAETGESIAYALQYERFQGRPPEWTFNWLSRVYVRRDPAWAMRYADLAVREKPTVPNHQYMLAAALYNTRQYAPADHYYRLAMEDAPHRLASLREVAEMWLTSRQVSNEVAVARGTPYLATLEQEYPKEGRAGFLRLILEERRSGRVRVESMRKALAGHDGSDEWQAERAASLRKALDAAPEGVR